MIKLIFCEVSEVETEQTIYLTRDIENICFRNLNVKIEVF